MTASSAPITATSLLELVNSSTSPLPWSEGDHIPWDDPDFSRRMLKEHLTQAHDLASRRAEKIDLHVRWIHEQLLGSQPGNILDLGCGPGLYAIRLAQLGHKVNGIDFSPASIAYAKETSTGTSAQFTQADIRLAEFGSGYDLVMLIYGEMNIFRPADIQQILKRVRAALKPGGLLLLEPSHYAALENEGLAQPGWFTSKNGLFSDQPHIVMEEHFWDPTAQAATNRFYVIDAQSGAVSRFAQSMQAYTRDQYQALLEGCGFSKIAFYPSLTGQVDDTQAGLFALTASSGNGSESLEENVDHD